MSMMSCSDVDAADPALLELLRETKDDVLRNNNAIKKNLPHLSDMMQNKNCGDCQRVGLQLMKCTCGKAHCCNKDCQMAQSKMHKIDNMAQMTKHKTKKKRRKEKRKESEITCEEPECVD